MSLDSVKKTYERLGREDPLYAVLSDKRFRNNRWDPVEFFKTGEREIGEVLAYVRGLGLELGKQRALDFGCGVGRLSQPLADHFAEVVGIDISESMVEAARRHNTRGERLRFIANATDDLRVIPSASVDFVYSNITLQHIPPEHARRYIREFFRSLRPGGAAVFMVPNGRPFRPGSAGERAYRLKRSLRRAWKRLRGRAPVEIHYIPRSEVETLIAGSGATLRDVADVDAAGGRPRDRRLRYCATKN